MVEDNMINDPEWLVSIEETFAQDEFESAARAYCEAEYNYRNDSNKHSMIKEAIATHDLGETMHKKYAKWKEAMNKTDKLLGL